MKRTLVVALATVGLTLATAGTSTAAKPLKTDSRTPASAVAAGYWGHWLAPALVYDATGTGTTFKVSEAVSEWSKSGWKVSMTTDPTKANITVLKQDPTSGDGAIGSADLTVSGGVISGCTVRLSPVLASMSLGEHAASHELGHCGGLPHSTSSKSIMYETVSSNTAMVRPSGSDLKWMAKNVY
ncbi:matrixin family metalloprotease [Intrasporangium flavum]|uniref:matrixin family metalloprotease n=1 Tax=Intrasporangium flavum TaxID=1428657 RepID=UPI00096FD48F|nr:matrixin family metalloprotease [Intrasporangium flavum]